MCGPPRLPLLLVWDAGGAGSGVRGLPASVQARGLRRATQRAESVRQAWVRGAVPAGPVAASVRRPLVFLEFGSRLW